MDREVSSKITKWFLRVSVTDPGPYPVTPCFIFYIYLVTFIRKISCLSIILPPYVGHGLSTIHALLINKEFLPMSSFILSTLETSSPNYELDLKLPVYSQSLYFPSPLSLFGRSVSFTVYRFLHTQLTPQLDEKLFSRWTKIQTKEYRGKMSRIRNRNYWFNLI